MLNAEGRTDRRTDMTKPVVIIRNFAIEEINARNNDLPAADTKRSSELKIL